MEKIRIYKEYLKRRYIDFNKSFGRIKTPMDMVILTLKANNLWPESPRAIDLFAMYGLWVTADYAHLCSHLELWEIDPLYAHYAKKFISNADVICGDSISAVKNHTFTTDHFDLIVIDNPSGVYGDQDYCEHFDLFPKIIEYLSPNSVLIIHGITDCNFYLKQHSEDYNQKWLIRRKEFYGQSDTASVIKIAPETMLYHYCQQFPFGKVKSFYIPRDIYRGFIVISYNQNNL